jgi:hypothetical protein
MCRNHTSGRNDSLLSSVELEALPTALARKFPVRRLREQSLSGRRLDKLMGVVNKTVP